MAIFIVIPLIVGGGLRISLVRRQGRQGIDKVLLPRFASVTIADLLFTLVFQNIMGKTMYIGLIAVPIVLQVYMNAALATIVGVLVEVPVTLPVRGLCNGTRALVQPGGRRMKSWLLFLCTGTPHATRWQRDNCGIWRAIGSRCSARAPIRSA